MSFALCFDHFSIAARSESLMTNSLSDECQSLDFTASSGDNLSTPSCFKNPTQLRSQLREISSAHLVLTFQFYELYL